MREAEAEGSDDRWWRRAG
eukprot:gene27116-biopygen6758